MNEFITVANPNLGISDLSNGVSVKGAQDYLDGIKMVAIANTIKAINNTDYLKSTLQQGWQGRAEANFEANLDLSCRAIVKGLNEMKASIESLITDLVETMLEQDRDMIEVDENLMKYRNESRGE